MKIAVLYICIGKYTVLWPEFYDSSRKYFFKKSQVHYFVFTDSDDFINSLCNELDVTCVKTKNYGWPGNTLFRFEMFLKIKSRLEQFDTIFFFNANTLFLSEINEDILPKSGELVVVEHFAIRNIDPILFEYDRNRRSTAYIPYGKEGSHYVQAGVIGGDARTFLQMSQECAKNINEDVKNHVIARWHDESHLNKYFLGGGRKYKLLPPIYIWPEMLPHKKSEIKILMRDKTRYADLTTMRYGKRSFWSIFLERLEFQRRKIEKYFYWCLKHLGVLRV